MPLERPKISTITDTSGTTYDLSAKYDTDGNEIKTTYAKIADIPPGSTPSSTTPKMDGTAAVGSETAFARGDHVHPSDTSREATSNKVTSLSSSSTDAQYPSAKAVYDFATGDGKRGLIEHVGKSFSGLGGTLATKIIHIENSDGYSQTPIVFQMSVDRSSFANLVLQFDYISSSSTDLAIDDFYCYGEGLPSYYAKCSSNTCDIYMISSYVNAAYYTISDIYTDYTGMAGITITYPNEITQYNASYLRNTLGCTEATKYEITKLITTSKLVTSLSSSSTNSQAPSAKAVYDTFVKKEGDTMSGNLKVERNGEAYVIVKNTNTDKQMEFLSSTAGNRGIYDDATGKWLAYFNTDNVAVYTPGYATSSGATWWRVRNNDIPREVDVGVSAAGVIGLYDRNNDKFMIQSDANGNISLPQVLSDAVKTNSNFITRSGSGVKGTNPSSLLGSGYFYMEKDSSGTTGANRFGSFEFAVDTAGATYTYVKAYRSVANSTDYGELSIVHPKTGAPYPRYRVSASGSITSYDVVPPVGSVICMSTNTAPSYPGTWELVDKEFKAQNVTKTTSVSINTTNVTSVTAVYAVYSNHTITVYVDGLKTKVALADNDLTLMTLTPANFGVSAFGNYQFNITAFSDSGDALITLNSSSGGVITSKDAFKIAAGSGTTHSVPAGTELSRFTIQYHIGGYSYLNDSYCDKFYFKRTA